MQTYIGTYHRTVATMIYVAIGQISIKRNLRPVICKMVKSKSRPLFRFF